MVVTAAAAPNALWRLLQAQNVCVDGWRVGRRAMGIARGGTRRGRGVIISV